jgi:hypothetical protein
MITFDAENWRAIICVGAIGIFSHTGSGGGCDDFCENEFPEPGQVGTCWEVVSNDGCVATVTGITTTHGDPGPPEVIGAVTCDACGSDQDHLTNFAYLEHSGWEWCISVGGGVEWKFPVGLQLGVSGETELCYDGHTATTVTAILGCEGRTRTKASVNQVQIPITVDVNIDYTRTSVQEVPPGAPATCPPVGTKIVAVAECGSDVRTVHTVRHEYYITFEDLDCPPAVVGECGGSTVAVYETVTEPTGPETRTDDHKVDHLECEEV